MSVIQAAMAHFKSKEIRSLPVPEWDATVYAKPLTMKQKGSWLARAKGSNTEYLLYAVIFGASGKDGKPLFSLDDLESMRNEVDADVVSRVAMFVLGNDVVGAQSDEDEREGN